MSSAGNPVATDVKHPIPTQQITGVSVGDKAVVTPTVGTTVQRVDPVITETSLTDVDYFFFVSESYRRVGPFNQDEAK